MGILFLCLFISCCFHVKLLLCLLHACTSEIEICPPLLWNFDFWWTKLFFDGSLPKLVLVICFLIQKLLLNLPQIRMRIKLVMQNTWVTLLMKLQKWCIVLYQHMRVSYRLPCLILTFLWCYNFFPVIMIVEHVCIQCSSFDSTPLYPFWFMLKVTTRSTTIPYSIGT